MTSTVENLVLDLLGWVQRRERTYHETMDAWRTSCPQLPVWEDANERRLVETTSDHGRLLVRVTPTGLALLVEKRPWNRPGPYAGARRTWPGRRRNRAVPAFPHQGFSFFHSMSAHATMSNYLRDPFRSKCRSSRHTPDSCSQR